MTKTSTPSSRRRAPGKRERLRTNRERIEADFPGLLAALEAPDPKRQGASFVSLWPDYEEQLADLVWPRWRSPAPTTEQRASGFSFDTNAVLRFLRFCTLLRHIKGRQFARRPFVPDLWQIVHLLAPVFGWRRADGTRAYREFYLEVSRKNGKSTLIAAIGLYLLVADGEPGAEIVSVAKDRGQARAVWAVGARMAKAAPALARRLRIPPHPEQRGDKIVFERELSVWTVLSKDAEGSKHHGLNLHGALIDELHTIDDPEMIGTIETGTGSREQPITGTITTAGIESSSPVWKAKRDHGIKVAERVVHDPDAWFVIFAADPKAATNGTWRKPAVWREANPGIGRSVQLEYLKRMATRAETDPLELARFLRLHLGIPTESAVSYIDLHIWDRSAGMVLEDDLVDAECYGGLDLSDSRDLTAFALVFPAADGALDVVMRVWTPADTLHARSTRDRADYVRWAADGYLIATPGEVIDYDLLELEALKLSTRFDIQGVNYDRWGSKQLRDRLEDAGLTMWEMGQGYASMSAPMKELARLVHEGKIRHGGNPVLRYALAGFKAAMDPAGNVKPDRKHSTSRIDPMSALIDAIDAWMRRETGGRSVYEERGLEVAG